MDCVRHPLWLGFLQANNSYYFIPLAADIEFVELVACLNPNEEGKVVVEWSQRFKGEATIDKHSLAAEDIAQLTSIIYLKL